MSSEIQRMFSKTSLIWQSRSLVRDSGSKGSKWTKERLCGGEYRKPQQGCLFAVLQLRHHWDLDRSFNFLCLQEHGIRLSYLLASHNFSDLPESSSLLWQTYLAF